jgi:hypothetical protein
VIEISSRGGPYDVVRENYRIGGGNWWWIVRAGKDRKDRNGDGRVLFHAEVERRLDRGARRQRRHRLYIFIALVKNGLEP